jgi:hypothetical protein
MVNNILIFLSLSELGDKLGGTGSLALIDPCRRRVCAFVDECVLPTDGSYPLVVMAVGPIGGGGCAVKREDRAGAGFEPRSGPGLV